MLCNWLEAGPASPALELWDSSVFEIWFKSTPTAATIQPAAPESSSTEWLFTMESPHSLPEAFASAAVCLFLVFLGHVGLANVTNQAPGFKA